MYFDWRLYRLARGGRPRILFAAAPGPIAVGAGVMRLATASVAIYRIFALAPILLSFAACESAPPTATRDVGTTVSATVAATTTEPADVQATIDAAVAATITAQPPTPTPTLKPVPTQTAIFTPTSTPTPTESPTPVTTAMPPASPTPLPTLIPTPTATSMPRPTSTPDVFDVAGYYQGTVIHIMSASELDTYSRYLAQAVERILPGDPRVVNTIDPDQIVALSAALHERQRDSHRILNIDQGLIRQDLRDPLKMFFVLPVGTLGPVVQTWQHLFERIAADAEFNERAGRVFNPVPVPVVLLPDPRYFSLEAQAAFATPTPTPVPTPTQPWTAVIPCESDCPQR